MNHQLGELGAVGVINKRKANKIEFPGKFIMCIKTNLTVLK